MHMEPTASSGFIAASMENPATELQDFDRVVQTYWSRIFRFVLASVRDSDVAETLTQDCFWNAYKHRATFRGDSSLNTWLIRIAINLVRDHTRSRRFQFWRKAERISSAEASDWLPDRSMSPEQRAGMNEQVQAIWNATRNLSQKQRTVFLLRFVEDMDNAEIAEATGMTENTVGVHLFRAVREIRKRVVRVK